MFKIPKSLTELKSMVSEVNLGDALTKVQAAAACVTPYSPLCEGELGEVIDQLKKHHEQEITLLKRLGELTAAFQQQIKETIAVPVVETEADVVIIDPSASTLKKEEAC